LERTAAFLHGAAQRTVGRKTSFAA
jgi:hypothetical protein